MLRESFARIIFTQAFGKAIIDIVDFLQIKNVLAMRNNTLAVFAEDACNTSPHVNKQVWCVLNIAHVAVI